MSTSLTLLLLNSFSDIIICFMLLMSGLILHLSLLIFFYFITYIRNTDLIEVFNYIYLGYLIVRMLLFIKICLMSHPIKLDFLCSFITSVRLPYLKMVLGKHPEFQSESQETTITPPPPKTQIWPRCARLVNIYNGF